MKLERFNFEVIECGVGYAIIRHHPRIGQLALPFDIILRKQTEDMRVGDRVYTMG